MPQLHRGLSDIMDNKSLDLESFLIIGASGTIGSAVARKLAAPGVSLGLHYCQNLEAVEKLKNSLEGVGVYCFLVQSPLDSEDSCARVLAEVYSEFGTIHGIAICGGRVPWKDWMDISAQDWQNVLFEHCVVPFILTKLAVFRMREKKKGRIVYLSSIAAKYGGSSRSVHYGAAKGALETAMHGLSREVARSGIRINCVRSGFVHSPQQQLGRSPQEIVERIQKIPMGRPGKPDEVAAVIAFLLSEESSFISGETVTVAGGD